MLVPLIERRTRGGMSSMAPLVGRVKVGPQVPRDGPNNWYMPQSAAHFAALGLAAPDFLWPCQETAGTTLANVIGAATTLAEAATGHAYAQTVTGWRRTFVVLDGTTANQAWTTTSAALDLAAGESGACLCLASVAVPAGTRLLMGNSATHGDWLGLSGTGLIRTAHAGVLVNSAVVQGGITNVQWFYWFRNATTNVSGAGSNTDAVANTHNEAAATGAKGLGAITGANTPATARIGLFAIYKGVSAERDWPAYIATLKGT